MPQAIIHETFTLFRGGLPHLCNKRDCQKLVDTDHTLSDPTGEFVNAGQLAKRETEETARVEAEQARAAAEAAKDREIDRLKAQLAGSQGTSKTDQADDPVKRGGKRPAPKAPEQPTDAVASN